MIQKALEYLISLKRPEIVISKNEKREFIISCDDQYIEIKPITYTRFELSTLTGLIDYLKMENENGHVDSKKSVIHVENINSVSVYTKEYDKFLNKNIQILIIAKEITRGFEHGQYYDIETFRIKLATFFANIGDKDNLIESISKIESNQIKISEDDGISQQVTAKTGIARKGTIELPKYVSLAPFRGFPEIEPVEEDFLFRIRTRGEDIQCSLFTTGSLIWQLEICQKIKDWLKVKLPDWDIVV